MLTTVTDWGEALLTSLAASMAVMFAAIPKIIGFALILAVGWFVAGLVAKLAAAVLRKIKVNELAERGGFADFIQKMGMKCDAAGFLASMAKWFMRLVVLVVAFDALGLPAVSDVLRSVLLWLPNLAVAMAVLIVGGLVAKGASRLLKGSLAKAGIGNPEVMAAIASVAVWAFAIIIAANQIGIAQTLVNTLFMGTVAMLVLAVGLSFGLGAKDTAGEIVRGWYDSVREAKPKLERAGSETVRESKEAVQAAKQEYHGSPQSTVAHR
jgi:hypothetical protein